MTRNLTFSCSPCHSVLGSAPARPVSIRNAVPDGSRSECRLRPPDDLSLDTSASLTGTLERYVISGSVLNVRSKKCIVQKAKSVASSRRYIPYFGSRYAHFDSTWHCSIWRPEAVPVAIPCQSRSPVFDSITVAIARFSISRSQRSLSTVAAAFRFHCHRRPFQSHSRG
ncbi:hypothetical protein EDB81DRAFT_263627 [Dactylonectria macrodidyma]|uniref:Uncharacterized protein n=1 Tax=Dactylonectria macrodidyma TaxID=307937 RepID=A0A9P9JJR6_9HYPO|nr:hypothetical protein EDB81DRAFT_263627 [Dactylonectria macrodidyma]